MRPVRQRVTELLRKPSTETAVEKTHTVSEEP